MSIEAGFMDGMKKFKAGVDERAKQASVVDKPQIFTVWIPPTFAEDHESRDLPTGKIIKQNSRFWQIEVTWEELTEWASDADYYYWEKKNGGFDAGEYTELAASAKRTLIGLRKVVEAAGLKWNWSAV